MNIKAIKAVLLTIIYTVMWFGAFSLNDVIFSPSTEKLAQLATSVFFGLVFTFVFRMNFFGFELKIPKKSTH